VTEPGETTVGRSFLKLGAGEAAARVIAFGATVYLARLLGAELYGIVVLALAVMLYLTCITDAGVDLLGVRDVADQPARLPELVRALLGARLLVAAALVGAMLLAGLLILPQPDGAILAIYAFLLLPFALNTRWVHIGLQRTGAAGLARVLAEGLAALLIVATVRGPGDLARAPLAQLIGEAAAALLLLRLIPGRIAALRPAVQPDALRALARRSWPLVAHTLLGLMIFNSDFFFLRAFHDSATVGLYAVAYTLVSFFLNLGGSYELSLLPAVTRLGRDPLARQALYGTAIVQAFSFAFPLAVGGALLAGPLVVLVFGAGYAPSAAPLTLLIWAVPVALFRNVAQTALIASGRQDRMLRTAAWAAGANLVLNALIIPIWGMLGAALATLSTEAVRTGLALFFAREAGLAPPGPIRLLRPFGAAAAMAAALWGMRAAGLPVLPAAALGGLVYFLMLLVSGGLTLVGGRPALRV
jgi:O-antigen/teichoic acid export membrane protein